jgi:MFS family permease
MNKKLLKNKNFMLVVLGNFVSLMGSNIQQFVLALYVLDRTGSATLFASMLAVSALPRILFSPFAGVFGDWFDKKKSIVILDLINVVVLSGFVYYMFGGQTLSIGLVFLLIVLLEITEVFFHASISVILPSVVEKEEYLEANSLRTMFVASSQLLAPLIAVAIYGSLGLMVAIMFNAVSFFLSAISEMFIKVKATESEKNERSFKGFKKDFKSGMKIIKNSKAIKIIISMAVIINFSISPFFSVGLFFLVREVLSRSTFEIGLLSTVLSGSMIVAPMLLTKKLKRTKVSHVLMFSFTLIGLLIIATSLSVHQLMYDVYEGLLSYVYVVVICFTIGILVTAGNIVINTLFQKIVPIEYMGRVSTVLGVFSTVAIPAGQMLFGYLYDIINPGLVFILNGFIILLVVVIFNRQMTFIDETDKELVQENIRERSVLAHEV